MTWSLKGHLCDYGNTVAMNLLGKQGIRTRLVIKLPAGGVVQVAIIGQLCSKFHLVVSHQNFVDDNNQTSAGLQTLQHTACSCGGEQVQHLLKYQLNNDRGLGCQIFYPFHS